MSHTHQDNECPSCGKINRCRCMKPKDSPKTSNLCKDCARLPEVPENLNIPVFPPTPLERPPHGLTPRYIIRGKRINEILLAMERYSSVERAIPLEWVDELRELIAIKE